MISYNDLFAKAAQLFDAGSLDDAEGILRQLDNVSPDNPHILNLLGLVAQTKGLHQEACSYFAAAIRMDKNKPEYYYNLAFSQQKCQEYHDALRNYQKVITLAPQIKEAYNEIACIYDILEQKNEAVFWWHKVLQLAPDYAIAAINLAKSQNNYEQLLHLSTQYPNEPLVWFDLAQIEYQQNHPHEAANYIKSALSLQADDAENNYLAGLIYEKLEDRQKAFDYLTQAENLNDKHYNAKLKLADLYSLQGNFNEAETRYKRLIELDKNQFAVHNNYAEMLYRQKRTSEALEEYRAAVLINPKSAETLNNLGAILRNTKDYNEALGLFFSALTYSPDIEAISINIAETIVLLAREDKSQALKIAENWLNNYPDNIYAQKILHALKGEEIANNNLYTERLFDAFADNYELVMQNLDYSAPLAFEQSKGIMSGRIADLGCGSGLAGQAVKSVQNQIIGVDISDKMLILARQKGVYDELVKSDIIEFLQKRHDFDWIMAADVLGYIGDLAEFIRLSAGKKLIFTIESNPQITSYQIQPNGRYQHNPEYINQLLTANGYKDISTTPLILRNEAGNPVDGLVFIVKT